MDFFNVANLQLYVAIGLSVVNGILMCFVGYKFLQILQLSSYKNRGYWYWLKDTKGKYISRIFMLSLLSTACLLVTNFILDINSLSVAWSYFGLIFYFYFVFVFINNLYNAPRKTPLKDTSRLSRLRFFLMFLMSILTFGLIAFTSQFLPQYRFAVVAVTPLLLPVVVPFVNMLMQPFEKANSMKYYMVAKHKIKKMPDLIKIGITGSYGKTSTKYILKTILSEKYSVCASPYSYNTTMGITKSIIQFLDFSHQVFIAEMGARFKGDIKELCELVDPQYGILLGIGNQHLHSFGSVENIVKTKSEIVDYVGQNNGKMIFDGTNEKTLEIYKNYQGNKFLASINDPNANVFAKDIVITPNGTDFTLCTKQGQSVKCHTVLLGAHNVQNILCASAVALDLGLTLEEIQSGINKIQFIEHRLQSIKNNGITILDDSFNGSVESSKSALEILKLFKTKKIIVTPGLVELGNDEKQANEDFGKRIAEVADEVIIVNVINSLSLKKGLSEANFNEEHIYHADSLKNAQELLKRIMEPNCVVLFYNDLPDNYT